MTTSAASAVQLSVVTTLYRSAGFLPEFHRRISAAAQKITPDYEIILVNDGSPDNSQAVGMALCDRDSRLTLIELSRNFGHHKAIMTGLARAGGQWVFLIDCDLEEEPELLLPFHEELKSSDADVVYGVQSQRKGSVFERISGWAFYRLINLLSSTQVPHNLATVRLMRRSYVRSLIQHRDQELFLAGLWAITGFKQRSVTITKLSLNQTTYSLRRKMWNFVNAVTSFTALPLVFIFFLGTAISILSGGLGAFLVIRRLFFQTMLEGWASLMVAIWFLGGLSLFSLGLIGIYLSKVFAETKPRPYTVIRSVYGRTVAEADQAFDEAI